MLAFDSTRQVSWKQLVKVEREMSALTKTDLEIICQKVVAETLREDEFSFQLHPNEQLSFDSDLSILFSSIEDHYHRISVKFKLLSNT